MHLKKYFLEQSLTNISILYNYTSFSDWGSIYFELTPYIFHDGIVGGRIPVPLEGITKK